MSAYSLTTLAPRSSAVDLLARLSPWPNVLKGLAGRDFDVVRGETETLDEYENRMGTGLMALYRDSREPEVFEALYCVAAPAVQQWIRGLLSRGMGHLDPTELLQDTFVNVYRYPAAFRDEHRGSFRVWVRTIAGNLVRRANAPRSRMHFQELPEGYGEPEDGRGTPATLALAEEQEHQLGGAWMLFLGHYAEAWKELSQRDRRTLHLVEVEGMSYAEAGELLGVGRSNMKMIVFRARKRVARRIRQRMNAAVFAPSEELERQAG